MRKHLDILTRLALPGSPYQLAMLRILVGAQVFMAVHSKAFDLFLIIGRKLGVKTIFPVWVENLIAANMVPGLVLACKILSIFLILGLFTRIILPILSISFILLYSFYYQSGDAPVQWMYLWVPLIILCCSRCSDVLSIDRKLFANVVCSNLQKYRWPIEFVIVWIAFIYFVSGLAKLTPLQNGIAWVMNGTTSQYIAYFRFLDSPLYFLFDAPFFDYSKVSIKWTLVSLYGLGSELLAVMLLVSHRYHFIVFVAIFFLHFGIYLIGIGAFLQTFLVLSIALVNPKWFDKQFNLERKLASTV